VTRRTRLLHFIEELLERSTVKFVLASLIVISVLPVEQARRLDLIIFPIFLIEFAARLTVLKSNGPLSRMEVAILVTDALALLSFLPLEQLWGDPVMATRVLRMIRFARLIMIGRFLRTLAHDLRRILAQRQMRHQLGFLLATVVMLTFFGGTILATFEVPVEDFDDDGQLDQGTLVQVLWWVFRQIEDPGNLVEDPTPNALLVIMSLVLTIAGVFVMSFIIGIGTSVVGALMEASRHRPVPLRHHTIVVGGGRNVRTVLEDLVDMYAKNRRRVRIALLSDKPQPPTYLDDPRFRGIEYRHGEPTQLEGHELLATASAKRVLVLSDEERGEAADAYAISSVIAARQKNTRCPIVVEMRHRRHSDVAQMAGGSRVNPVPMGKLLGSLMSQSLMFPGIDSVLEELLTAHGSEIYTHLYQPEELQALQRRRGDGLLSYRDLLLGAYCAHHVIPLGVIVGNGEWTNDVRRLTFWLNPLEQPSPEATPFGAQADGVPLTALRGLVAVAPEYAALRRAARSLAAAPGSQCDRACRTTGPPPTLSASLSQEMLALRRVLVLGDNEVLPAMLENTADFVGDLEFVVVVPSAQRLTRVAAELARRTGQPLPHAGQEYSFSLPRRGRVHLCCASPDMLTAGLEHPWVQAHPLDAVVLLADLEEKDPDAQSALMLLRLLQLVSEHKLQVGPWFRVVAEALSGPKGELLERRLSQDSPVPVRVIPTHQMRAYFLVHSAYVPGSDQVHFELLSPWDQDLCQLTVAPNESSDRELTFLELIEALSHQSPPVIPFAVRLAPSHPQAGLVLNPAPQESRLRFRPSQVEAVYAVGETARFAPTAGKTVQ
jgi:hypothetical protein